MPVVVRRLRSDEGRRLAEVRLAALVDAPFAFGSTHAAEAALPAQAWEERAASSANGTDRVTFLAVDEDTGATAGVVGGFRETSGNAASDRVELVSMWIAPSHRRRGVARALVRAVLDWAEASGAAAVSLWVTRGNDPAERLYRSLGFEATGEVAVLPSDPCKDELRMIKHLGDGQM